MTKQVLGRGLSALITGEPAPNRGQIKEMNIKEIVPSPFQPRKDFDSTNLKELIQSIKTKGLIQPIQGTVTEIVEGTVNVIKTIKVIRQDGRVDLMEVAELIVKAVSLLGPLQKFGRWIANLFRRKDKRRPL